MRARTGGAWKEVSGGRVRVAGAWKNLVRIRARVAGAWKDVAVFVQPLTASASPAAETAIQNGAGAATTSPVTVTPAGGIGPYTYSWVRITGTGGTIASPTSASTTFTRIMGDGEIATNVFRCTVTDSLASTATVDVSVEFISIESGGFEP